MKTTTTTSTETPERSIYTPKRVSASSSQPRAPTTTSTTARNMLRSSFSTQSRRRSSTSDIALAQASVARSSTIFRPLPKRGFFYSRAYREHKERRKKKKMGYSSSDDGDSSAVDDDIPLKRDLTRRKRNSFHKKYQSSCVGGGNRKNFEPTNVTAYLAARVESEKPNVDSEVYNHATALGHAWVGAGGSGPPKNHMMDVALVGGDQVRVHASRFILACYSPVLEEVFFKDRKCPYYDAASSELVFDFCNEDVIRAAVHHCFTGELPAEFGVTNPDENVARNLAQLDHLAHVYKFSALGEVTYRALRKLINRRAVLACAIFDELSCPDGACAGAVDSIKRYALDSMREMPMDTLLGGGVQWMKEESVEAIMQDMDMDVDEFYMFKVLKAWASSNSESSRLPVARRLSEYIELKFIESELLLSQVKASGYFTQKQITEAVKLIKDSLANRDPHEMERVLVTMAGTELVNGIYCRVNNEVGMGEEEILFVKEADDGFSDVGLYLWGTQWHIAMCADYSNCFYSCKDPPDKSSTELVPGSKWAVQYGGLDPPPYCTYLPNTRMGRLTMGRMNTQSEKSLLAPNLEEMMDPTIAEKRRSGYFDKRTDDVASKRAMTLEQMMNLPEDRKEIILQQHK